MKILGISGSPRTKKADVIITNLLLARSMELDVERALQKKIDKI